MAYSPAERHEEILQWLKEDHLLRIDELAARLDVSNMTVHRDLDKLSEQGLVEKVHGGVRLPDPQLVTLETCHYCKMPVKRRLHFFVTTSDGQTLHACCPHCGLLLLDTKPDAVSALLRDFIYGRIINVRQAYFVIGSRIAICCEPTVLAFTGEADAADFQQGFGGEVMDFEQARRYLPHTQHIC